MRVEIAGARGENRDDERKRQSVWSMSIDPVCFDLFPVDAHGEDSKCCSAGSERDG